ncbi:MAG: regulatory iron-sulfur-containing complex subunit RicT [bacterium]
MPIVVGIVIRKNKENILADAGHFDLQINEKVVVETDSGLELGEIIEPEKMIEKPKTDIFKVIRKASADDLKRIQDNKHKTCQAISKIKQCVENHELEMKLTFVEYSFDRSKLFIYYTAESRVDFRELIKDLGHMLKTRIQMVQIGVRDEARMIGGMGLCGRELCCETYLKEFTPVSIDMAKEQDISLNTAKISGLCGRLMCCLSYEQEYYCNVKKTLPPIRSTVKTPEGEGTVIGMNCITQEISVDLGEGKLIKVPAGQVSKADISPPLQENNKQEKHKQNKQEQENPKKNNTH